MPGVVLRTVGATAASLLSPWLVRELIRAVESGSGGVSVIAWISG